MQADQTQIVKPKENTTNQKDKLPKKEEKQIKKEEPTKDELTKEEEFRVFNNIYTIYSI